MAVFFDTGNGDIYGGPTKEAVIAAMKEDMFGDDFDEEDMFEVDGSTKMHAEQEDGGICEELTTLEAEYCEELGEGERG
jgi:hypothetical protein